MITDKDALLKAIVANPDEDTPRLAYADWLQEHGDEADRARAEFIRVQVKKALLGREAEACDLGERLEGAEAARYLATDAFKEAAERFKQAERGIAECEKRERALLDIIGKRQKGELEEETRRLLTEASRQTGEEARGAIGEALRNEMRYRTRLPNPIVQYLARKLDAERYPFEVATKLRHEARKEVFGDDIPALIKEMWDQWKLPEWEQALNQQDFSRGFMRELKLTAIPSPKAIAKVFAEQPVRVIDIDNANQEAGDEAILAALHGMQEYRGVKVLRAADLPGAALRRLLDHPTSQALEHLEIVLWQSLEELTERLGALADAKALPSLRVLRIGYRGSAGGRQEDIAPLAAAAERFIRSPAAQSLEVVGMSQRAAVIFAALCQRNPGCMPKLHHINGMEVLHQSGRTQVNMMGHDRCNPDLDCLNLNAR